LQIVQKFIISKKECNEKISVVIAICWDGYFTAHGQRANSDQIETSEGMLTVQPIQHGTLVLSWNGQDVYIDPTGGAASFEGLAAPDMILITHAHGDHMDPETLNVLDTEWVPVIVPKSVADELPEMFNDQVVILNNGDTATESGVGIEAFPMYNLPPATKR